MSLPPTPHDPATTRSGADDAPGDGDTLRARVASRRTNGRAPVRLTLQPAVDDAEVERALTALVQWHATGDGDALERAAAALGTGYAPGAGGLTPGMQAVFADFFAEANAARDAGAPDEVMAVEFGLDYECFGGTFLVAEPVVIHGGRHAGVPPFSAWAHPRRHIRDAFRALEEALVPHLGDLGLRVGVMTRLRVEAADCEAVPRLTTVAPTVGTPLAAALDAALDATVRDATAPTVACGRPA